MELDNWDHWIDGLRRGDKDVQFEFMRRFGPQLEKVAERHLTGDVKRRIGPEDAVQSACRTFLRRTSLGEFTLPDSEALWRLLCAITVTKVREQTRYHLRQKRGLAQEQHLDSVLAHKEGGQELADALSSPETAVDFADAFEHLLKGLDEEERQLVDLKLQELPNEQIAEKLGCSERTVRRLLNKVQSKIEQMFVA